MGVEKGGTKIKLILLEEIFAFRDEENNLVYKKNLSILDDRLIKAILRQNTEKYIDKYKELRYDEEESKYNYWSITRKDEKKLKKLFQERNKILKSYLEKSDRNTNVMNLLIEKKLLNWQ